MPKASSDELAPLTVPHLYWRCSVSGVAHSFPQTIEALIDDSAHIVLISEVLVRSLTLKHRILHEPLPVELTIPETEKKCTINLLEWVKLKLYDPSCAWAAKTVHAVISPSLCAPVILGIPFLAHNNIVIDHAARTVIDKISNFDLMNPSPPPPPKPLKQTLKQFFKDLQEDRKLMLTELKMVWAERLCTIRNCMEDVKPVDVVGALHIHIKALTAQDQLDRLNDAVKYIYIRMYLQKSHILMNFLLMFIVASN